MIVHGMYFGKREVVRVYRAGQQIWPVGPNVELSVLMDIFTNGYHALLVGETIVLASHETAVSVAAPNAFMVPILPLVAEHGSVTAAGGYVVPMDSVVCVCNADSMTRAELDAVSMGAVTFTSLCDINTSTEAQAFAAVAVHGAHEGGDETEIEASSSVAGAVYGDHQSSNATTSEAAAEVPTAIFGAFDQDNGTTDDAAVESHDVVFAASKSDNKTDSSVTVIPFRVDGVVEMDADTESQTGETAELVVFDSVPVSSMLQLVSTCTAHLLAASAPNAVANSGVKTSAAIFLHFDSEEPEVAWYDPIRIGDNLYIRSAWLFWNDGDKGHIDTDVWYEVIRDGSNLYIRSVDSSWQDAEKAYIDLSVFYEPKQKDNNLYIRSADSVWTDGDNANIDTEFFLEPVQDGNNLYIRQNIFGGE